MDECAQRDRQLLILEAAAEAEESSPDFDALLTSLDLPLSYKEILIEVLRAGRWRTGLSPMGKIRSAVLRAVFKSETKGQSRREVYGVSSSTIDAAGFRRNFSGTLKIDGIWRSAGGREAENAEWLHERRSSIEKVRPDLRISIEPSPRLREWIVDPIIFTNWKEAAARAGLDQWETRALLLMATGLTRYAAMKVTESESDKRSIEAAWKRLERSKLKSLRTVLSTLDVE